MPIWMVKADAAEIKMVTIASGRQVQDVQTQILNHGPHTVGNIIQNGVAKDKAVLNFHAVGKTERGAYGAIRNSRAAL